jgi:DNA (cytosine-5)-methyltransferase 1
LREVIGELESMGYSVSWGIFSAREVGAPHQRKRVFILAMADSAGSRQDWKSSEPRPNCIEQSSFIEGGSESGKIQKRSLWPTRPGQPQHGWEPPRVVGNAESNWQTQPSLGRDADGVADRLDYAELQVTCDNRTDELRLLGNGVVPATAERAFRTLLEELNP